MPMRRIDILHIARSLINMDSASLVAVVVFTACATLGPAHRGVRAEGDGCAKKFDAFPGHTACLSKSSDAEVMELTDQEKTDVLNKHNTLRGGVTPEAINMMKMSWDNEIAMIAQKWANTCPLVNGKLKHDKGQTRLVPGRFNVGQNIAYGYSDFEKAIDAWYAEESDYTYGNTYSSHSDSEPIGHYTQVVWAKSVKLGCGRARCSGQIIYVCNYSPAGNVADFDRPYETGSTRASGCKTKDNGLCDCGDLVCENGRTLDPSTCTCDCGIRFIEPGCSLNCNIDDAAHCGSGSYVKPNCILGLASFVSSACPKQCDICPYAEKGYVDDDGGDGNGDGGNGDGGNGDDGNGDDGNGDGGNGDGGNGGDGKDGDDDNKDKEGDGGASTPPVYLSLILVTSLVSTIVL